MDNDNLQIRARDEHDAVLQLAARWVELYGQPGEDRQAVLERFRATHDYLDAVIHGVEPPQVFTQTSDRRATR